MAVLPTLNPRSAGFHDFYVSGAPVSVNRYGTAVYRSWRTSVFTASMLGLTGTSPVVAEKCSVKIRYFRNLDPVKDVDNILKAILDGLDGRIGGVPKKQPHRILQDDSHIEKVVSQRTDLTFNTVLNGRGLRPREFSALMDAQWSLASVYVRVDAAPNHSEALV